MHVVVGVFFEEIFDVGWTEIEIQAGQMTRIGALKE